MTFKNDEAKAASKAIHKTLQMIEDEFEIELDKEHKLKFHSFIFMTNLLVCCILLKYCMFSLVKHSCVKG